MSPKEIYEEALKAVSERLGIIGDVGCNGFWEASNAKKSADAIEENLSKLERLGPGGQIHFSETPLNVVCVSPNHVGLGSPNGWGGASYSMPRLVLQDAIRGGATVSLPGEAL